MRSESAALRLENRRFLPTLSLGYPRGAPSPLNTVKEGKRLFQQKARKKHDPIVPLATGVSALAMGVVPLAPGLRTRLIIMRRITRHKDRTTGSWRVRIYFSALAPSFPWSVATV